jgi:hypothetical protein
LIFKQEEFKNARVSTTNNLSNCFILIPYRNSQKYDNSHPSGSHESNTTYGNRDKSAGDVLANLSNNHSDENTAISNTTAGDHSSISKELTDTKDKLKIVT